MRHAPCVPNERGFLRHPTRRPTCVVLLAVLLASCGGARSAREAPLTTSAPALHRGELTDFVPAAGLRWLVSGSPAELARQPVLALLQQRWLTPQRLRAFSTGTGIDLLGTERGLVAGFDLGTLYMADASGWVAPPERLFAERLAGSERLHKTHPRVWRVTGLVGSEPEALVRVDDDLVAVAVGDPTLARIVELFAEGASLASLRRSKEHRSRPCRRRCCDPARWRSTCSAHSTRTGSRAAAGSWRARTRWR